MNHRISTGFTIAVSVFSLALISPVLASAHANSGDLAIIGGEALGASAGTAIGGSASADTGSAGVTVNADTSVSAGTGSAGDSGSLNASGNAGTMTNDSMQALSVTRSNVSSEGSAAASSSNQVMTRDDLNAYASAAVRDDSRIQGVDFANDTVSLKYHQQGKLFGFIPVTMMTRTSVDANGNVTMSYPWYHFLVSSKDMSSVRADIQTRAKAMLAAQGNAQGGAHLTARAQAELLDQIRVALESVAVSADSSTRESANTSASGNTNTGAAGNTDTNTSANGAANSGY